MSKLAFNISGIEGTPYLVPNPIGNTSFDQPGSLGYIISTFLNLAIIFAGILLLVWLIMGAFEWMTSSGDKEKLAKARNRMVSAIIGFVIVVLAFTLKTYIQTVLDPNNLINMPLERVSQP